MSTQRKVAGYATQGYVVNKVLADVRQDTDGVVEAITKAIVLVDDACVLEPKAADQILGAVVRELLRPRLN